MTLSLFWSYLTIQTQNNNSNLKTSYTNIIGNYWQLKIQHISKLTFLGGNVTEDCLITLAITNWITIVPRYDFNCINYTAATFFSFLLIVSRQFIKSYWLKFFNLCRSTLEKKSLSDYQNRQKNNFNFQHLLPQFGRVAWGCYVLLNCILAPLKFWIASSTFYK